MITYGLLKEGKFLVVKLSERVDKKTLSLFMEYLFHQKELVPGIKKVLMDYREAVMDIKMADLDEIARLRVAYSDVLKNIQTAHLVATAHQTAFTTLFSEKVPKTVSDIGICSTLGRAIQLLDINISERELEEQIQSLAFSYRIPDHTDN